MPFSDLNSDVLRHIALFLPTGSTDWPVFLKPAAYRSRREAKDKVSTAPSWDAECPVAHWRLHDLPHDAFADLRNFRRVSRYIRASVPSPPRSLNIELKELERLVGAVIACPEAFTDVKRLRIRETPTDDHEIPPDNHETPPESPLKDDGSVPAKLIPALSLLQLLPLLPALEVLDIHARFCDTPCGLDIEHVCAGSEALRERLQLWYDLHKPRAPYITTPHSPFPAVHTLNVATIWGMWHQAKPFMRFLPIDRLQLTTDNSAMISMSPYFTEYRTFAHLTSLIIKINNANPRTPIDIIESLESCENLRELFVSLYDRNGQITVVNRFPRQPQNPIRSGGEEEFLQRLAKLRFHTLDMCLAVSTLSGNDNEDRPRDEVDLLESWALSEEEDDDGAAEEDETREDEESADGEHWNAYAVDAMHAATKLAALGVQRGWWWKRMGDEDDDNLQGYERVAWAVRSDEERWDSGGDHAFPIESIVLVREPQLVDPVVKWDEEAQSVAPIRQLRTPYMG